MPFYQKAITRAKESVLHNNPFAMRSAIDEYSFDKQKAPQSLQDLVKDGYLHDVPKDPITQKNRDTLEGHHGGRGAGSRLIRTGHL